MPEPIVRLEKVSKRYRIYHRRHQSLKEALLHRSLGHWEDFWGLREASFEVPAGQVLGVIGRNGSGKSTLLKLLTGILAPDEGRLWIGGRVSSLLELGAGFQPEYTGRENVLLYGTILGLRRKEIEARFDEIVEFSELGSFIDSPVKNYSSGMYMRLGFSVAVHLDPEILLIDEVLAVGDGAFQNKCFEHLRKLQKAGCTIVLVSHDLESIARFCERAIWLDHGRVAADGSTDSTIHTYLDRTARKASESTPELGPGGTTGGDVSIESVRYLDAAGQERFRFESGEAVTVEVGYTAVRKLERLEMGLTIFRNDGVRALDAPYRGPLAPGPGLARLQIPSLQLSSGLYDITLAMFEPSQSRMHQYHDRMYPFIVHDPNGMGGLIWVDYKWKVGLTDRSRSRSA